RWVAALSLARPVRHDGYSSGRWRACLGDVQLYARHPYPGRDDLPHYDGPICADTRTHCHELIREHQVAAWRRVLDLLLPMDRDGIAGVLDLIGSRQELDQ